MDNNGCSNLIKNFSWRTINPNKINEIKRCIPDEWGSDRDNIVEALKKNVPLLKSLKEDAQLLKLFKQNAELLKLLKEDDELLKLLKEDEFESVEQCPTYDSVMASIDDNTKKDLASWVKCVAEGSVDMTINAKNISRELSDSTKRDMFLVLFLALQRGQMLRPILESMPPITDLTSAENLAYLIKNSGLVLTRGSLFSKKDKLFNVFENFGNLHQVKDLSKKSDNCQESLKIAFEKKQYEQFVECLNKNEYDGIYIELAEIIKGGIHQARELLDYLDKNSQEILKKLLQEKTLLPDNEEMVGILAKYYSKDMKEGLPPYYYNMILKAKNPTSYSDQRVFAEDLRTALNNKLEYFGSTDDQKVVDKLRGIYFALSLEIRNNYGNGAVVALRTYFGNEVETTSNTSEIIQGILNAIKYIASPLATTPLQYTDDFSESKCMKLVENYFTKGAKAQTMIDCWEKASEGEKTQIGVKILTQYMSDSCKQDAKDICHLFGRMQENNMLLNLLNYMKPSNIEHAHYLRISLLGSVTNPTSEFKEALFKILDQPYIDLLLLRKEYQYYDKLEDLLLITISDFNYHYDNRENLATIVMTIIEFGNNKDILQQFFEELLKSGKIVPIMETGIIKMNSRKNASKLYDIFSKLTIDSDEIKRSILHHIYTEPFIEIFKLANHMNYYGDEIFWFLDDYLLDGEYARSLEQISGYGFDRVALELLATNMRINLPNEDSEWATMALDLLTSLMEETGKSDPDKFEQFREKVIKSPVSTPLFNILNGVDEKLKSDPEFANRFLNEGMNNDYIFFDTLVWKYWSMRSEIVDMPCAEKIRSNFKQGGLIKTNDIIDCWETVENDAEKEEIGRIVKENMAIKCKKGQKDVCHLFQRMSNKSFTAFLDLLKFILPENIKDADVLATTLSPVVEKLSTSLTAELFGVVYEPYLPLLELRAKTKYYDGLKRGFEQALYDPETYGSDPSLSKYIVSQLVLGVLGGHNVFSNPREFLTYDNLNNCQLFLVNDCFDVLKSKIAQENEKVTDFDMKLNKFIDSKVAFGYPRKDVTDDWNKLLDISNEYRNRFKDKLWQLKLSDLSINEFLTEIVKYKQSLGYNSDIQSGYVRNFLEIDCNKVYQHYVTMVDENLLDNVLKHCGNPSAIAKAIASSITSVELDKGTKNALVPLFIRLHNDEKLESVLLDPTIKLQSNAKKLGKIVEASNISLSNDFYNKLESGIRKLFPAPSPPPRRI